MIVWVDRWLHDSAYISSLVFLHPILHSRCVQWGLLESPEPCTHWKNTKLLTDATELFRCGSASSYAIFSHFKPVVEESRPIPLWRPLYIPFGAAWPLSPIFSIQSIHQLACLARPHSWSTARASFRLRTKALNRSKFAPLCKVRNTQISRMPFAQWQFFQFNVNVGAKQWARPWMS